MQCEYTSTMEISSTVTITIVVVELVVHVFCDHNLAIILIFAVLELWLISLTVNSFLLYNFWVTPPFPHTQSKTIIS